MVKEEGFTVWEKGRAYGTFPGTVSARMQIKGKHVDVVFTMHTKGGSVTGDANARYVLQGEYGYYGGTLTVTHGTGAYRHAHGSLAISGTIKRKDFSLVVKARGTISF